MGAELVLKVRSQHARLDAGGAGGFVDFEDLVHGAEVDGDGGAGRFRHAHAIDHGGAAPEGDSGDAVGVAPVEDGFDLLIVAGPRDEIRGVSEVTLDGGDSLQEATAVGVGGPFIGVAEAEAAELVGHGDAGDS